MVASAIVWNEVVLRAFDGGAGAVSCKRRLRDEMKIVMI